MDFDGETRIAASPALVWQALNDPAHLAACIPGCERFEPVGEGFSATVAIRIGSLAARFGGTVTLSEVVEEQSYTLTGQGQGGVAGFVRGHAEVSLKEDGAGTVLRWTAKAELGGRVASVGGRLLHGFATRMAGEFFSRLAERLGTE
jgi:carbon monoxide dehydrogenase subunit G